VARVQQAACVVDVRFGVRGTRVGKTAGFGNADEIDAGIRVARLHAGLAVMAVVEHHDGEICWLLDADRREAAEAHQHLAVAGDHRGAAVGTRKRKPETNHRRTAHRAPKIEIERMIACGGDVVGRRAEAGDDEQIAAIDEQAFDDVAPIKHARFHFQ
jgi:hypothetical protein